MKLSITLVQAFVHIFCWVMSMRFMHSWTDPILNILYKRDYVHWWSSSSLWALMELSFYWPIFVHYVENLDWRFDVHTLNCKWVCTWLQFHNTISIIQDVEIFKRQNLTHKQSELGPQLLGYLVGRPITWTQSHLDAPLGHRML